MAEERKLFATPPATLITHDLAEARSFEEGKRPVFSVYLRFEKGTDLSGLRAFFQDALKDAFGQHTAGKDIPLQDGDAKTEKYADAAGCTFMRLSTGEKFPPDLFDLSSGKLVAGAPPAKFYNGCTVRAVLSAWDYRPTKERPKSGSGVSANLVSVAFLKDGEPLKRPVDYGGIYDAPVATEADLGEY